MTNEQILEWNKNLAELLPKLKINEDGKYCNLRYKQPENTEWWLATERDVLPAEQFTFSHRLIYEIIDEPEMIPLDFTDILDIMGKWLVDGRGKKECFVGIYDSFDKLICIKYEGDYANLSFQDLQKYFTFRDTGKRLEKEKK